MPTYFDKISDTQIEIEVLEGRWAYPSSFAPFIYNKKLFLFDENTGVWKYTSGDYSVILKHHDFWSSSRGESVRYFECKVRRDSDNRELFSTDDVEYDDAMPALERTFEFIRGIERYVASKTYDFGLLLEAARVFENGG